MCIFERLANMSLGILFNASSAEAEEKAARIVISQLSNRLHFSKQQPSVDEEIECLQFGICTYET